MSAPLCEEHAVARDVPCRRCGDFTCPLCAAALGLGAVPICRACVDRVAGEVHGPAKIQLRHWDGGEHRFPDACPNCFRAPARTPLKVTRSGGVRFEMSWPHCATCARDGRRLRRWEEGVRAAVILGIGGLLILAPLAGLRIVLSEAWAAPIAFASIALIPLAYVAYFVACRRAARPPTAITFGPGIQLIGVGPDPTGFIGTKGLSLKAVVLRPDYARAFLALNAEFLGRS